MSIREHLTNLWSMALSNRILLLVIITNFVLMIFPDNFKLGFVFYTLLLFLFYAFTKHIVFSVFMIMVLGSQFLTPGKYYVYQVIPAHEFQDEALPLGVVSAYGVTVTDFFSLLMVLLFLKMFFVKTIRQKNKKFITFIRKNTLIKIFILCWWVYFAASVFSSVNLSFHLTSSIVYLLQYMRLPLFFFVSLYLLFNTKTENYFLQMLSGILITQLLIGALSFVLNLLSVSTLDWFVPSYRLPEEEYLLRNRIKGTFLHANQYAFLIFLLFMVTITYTKTLFKKNFALFFSFFLLIILLTQSRIVWLISFLSFSVIGLENKKTILATIKNIWNKKYAKLFIILFAIISVAIVYPRISLSKYFFTQSGGGGLRYQMLTEGSIVLSQSPLFGYGIITVVYQMWEQFPNGYVSNFPLEVHIGYLQMALESGLIGLFAFFIPFYLVLSYYLTKIRKNKKQTITSRNFLIVTAIFLYYCIQPYAGAIEFSYLGICLAFLIISLYKINDVYKKN